MTGDSGDTFDAAFPELLLPAFRVALRIFGNVADAGDDYGDGTPAGGFGGHLDCVAMYGPWTTPPPAPVHDELTFQHTNATPGTYVAKFPFGTLGDCARGPSQATGTATVSVSP